MSFAATKRRIEKENDQKLRAELQARRKALTAHVRELKRARRESVRKVSAWCGRSRARTAALAKQVREEHRRAAREEIVGLRAASKDACAKRKAKAKRSGGRDRLLGGWHGIPSVWGIRAVLKLAARHTS